MIGVDIGGTHFRVGLIDQNGLRLSISEGETVRSEDRVWMLQRIRELCRALMEKSDAPIKACGVSFGGPVDFEGQRVSSVHAPGWTGFALAQWVQDSLDLPCRVDNDANAGAVGEYRFGAGRGSMSIVYITLSTGIGSGLVLGGSIFRGKDNLAGELGHVPVADSEVPCACGARGCLEALWSGTAIARAAQECATRRPREVVRLLEISGGQVQSITARTVVEAAREGDKISCEIIRVAARWLARGLLTVIRVVNPDKIVLGGGLTQAGSVLVDQVHKSLEEMRSPSIGYSTEILLAELGGSSPLYGAAAMALDLVGKSCGVTT